MASKGIASTSEELPTLGWCTDGQAPTHTFCWRLASFRGNAHSSVQWVLLTKRDAVVKLLYRKPEAKVAYRLDTLQE